MFVPGHPVQEDEKNSTETQTSPHSDSDLVHRSQTGTSFTSKASFGQEGVRGRLYEDRQWSHGPGSTPSYQDQGLSHPSLALQGLSVAGTADKETLPLPEEEPNNGADASGAVHLTDGPMPATVGTYTNYHQILSTSSLLYMLHSENTETSDMLLQTQMAVKHATATSSNTDRVIQTSELSKATETEHTMSSSRVPKQDDWSSAHTATEDTFSSSSQGPGQAHLPSTRGTGIQPSDSTVDTASPYSHTHLSESSASPVSDDTHDTSKMAEMIHKLPFSTLSQTDSPPGTESTVHSLPPSMPSPSPQARDMENETRTERTQRDTTDANTATYTWPSGHDASTVHGWSSAASSPRAALMLGDIIQSPATTGTTSDPQVTTLLPTHRLPHMHTNVQTPLPHLFPHASAIPSHAYQTSIAFSSSPHFTHTLFPLNSRNTVSTVPIPTTDHTTAISSQTQVTESISSHTPPKQNLLPLTNAPTEHPQSNNMSTTDISLHSLPPEKSDNQQEDGGVDVDTRTESWKWFPSSSATIASPTTGWPQQPLTQTVPYSGGENHTTLTPPVFNSTHTWSSTTNQTPRIYIVPDQPVTIRGIVWNSVCFVL